MQSIWSERTVLFTKRQGTGTLRMGVHYPSSSDRNQMTLLLSDRMRNAVPILHPASPGRAGLLLRPLFRGGN